VSRPDPTTYEVEHLHQPHGWLSPGYLTIAEGRVTAVAAAPPRGAAVERLSGYVIPGMHNLHSHAFQRALAGRTESVDAERSSDNLWTWREAMYRLVDNLGPDHYEAIAEFTYLQLLKGGFTTVCEFHYLHHAPGGARYANPAEMSERLLAAATSSGIAITLLPTLYQHGGIDRDVSGPQRRFAHADLADYLGLLDTLCRQVHPGGPAINVGIGLHSLRAVAPQELAEVTKGNHAWLRDCRIHIHVSETEQEVQEVEAGLGARPVAWLLKHAGIDERWTLVHATHLDAAERAGLAGSRAVAGLCPLTEATLGDGLFPLVEHQRAGGCWGIGTDSHYSASVAAELRMLECGQRLRHQRRNILADPQTPLTAHSGRRLFDLAVHGGSVASGSDSGALVPGRRADLVVLDAGAPGLLGHGPETVLDAWILGDAGSAVRDVMVDGRWVVRDGRHPREEAVTRRFAKTLATIDSR
jgi:formimidoylglutamate deiminase